MAKPPRAVDRPARERMAAFWKSVRYGVPEVHNPDLQRWVDPKLGRNSTSDVWSGNKPLTDVQLQAMLSGKNVLNDDRARYDERMKPRLDELKRLDDHLWVRERERRPMYARPATEERAELHCDAVLIGALNYDSIIAKRPKGTEKRELVSLVFSQELEQRLDSWDELQDVFRNVQKQYTAAELPNIYQRELGGSAFNVARVLSASGWGLRVGFVGIDADSPYPDQVESHRDWLERHDVVTDDVHVPTNESRGGECVSLPEKHGRMVERRMRTWPGANEDLALVLSEFFWETVDRCSSSSLVHMTSILDHNAPEVLADLWEAIRTEDTGTLLSVDPGHAWAETEDESDRKQITRILAASHLLFVNQQELEAIAKRFCRHRKEELNEASAYAQSILGQFETLTIIVAKYRGATRIYRRGAPSRPGADPTIETLKFKIRKVVAATDDTGAGDVFAGAFLGQWLTQRPGFPSLAYRELLDHPDTPEHLRTASERGMAMAAAWLQAWGPLSGVDIEWVASGSDAHENAKEP